VASAACVQRGSLERRPLQAGSCRRADNQSLLWDCDSDVLLDHAPPHFHAVYAGYEAVIEIETDEILRGVLPERALRLLREWTSIHRDELAAN